MTLEEKVEALFQRQSLIPDVTEMKFIIVSKLKQNDRELGT